MRDPELVTNFKGHKDVITGLHFNPSQKQVRKLGSFIQKRNFSIRVGPSVTFFINYTWSNCPIYFEHFKTPVTVKYDLESLGTFIITRKSVRPIKTCFNSNLFE